MGEALGAGALDHRGRMRVAVTGLGVKTAAGTDVDTFWSTLVAGRSAAAPITRYDPSDLPVRFGCEVNDFDPTTYLGAKDARRVDRVTQLGFGAAVDALADAGEHRCDPARSAVIVGTGVGGLITLEERFDIEVPEDDLEGVRRHHRDAVRLEGTELLCRHRLRRECQRDRRSRASHP